MTIKITSDIQKPLVKWSNKDFTSYYFNKLYFLTNKKVEIPPIAWQGFAGRIKGFRSKLNVSNKDYKNFIDEVFVTFFVKKRYVPCFGSIISEKVWHIFNKYKGNSNEQFEALQDQLYGNTILFSKVSDFNKNGLYI